LCISDRIKNGAANSYLYVKSIAEEIRGLAVEYSLPIVTATQSNRTAVDSSDYGIDSVSDSFGLPMTLDLFIALIATEEMQEMNLIRFKQLKNRFNDPSWCRSFFVGVDKSKMKLYNVKDSDQDLVDGPDFEDEYSSDVQVKNKFDSTKFKGWN